MTRKRSTQRGIACPECGSDRSEVNESRHNPGDNTIRRRRICHGCLARYTTYEMLTHPSVINQMADHAASNLVGRAELEPFLQDLQKLIDKHRA
jgi:transcriptional regulator NrdR family protein